MGKMDRGRALLTGDSFVRRDCNVMGEGEPVEPPAKRHGDVV